MRVRLPHHAPPAHPAARLTAEPSQSVKDHNDDRDDEDSRVLIASLLIPGRGDPIENGALVVTGSTIAWVGSSHDLPSKYRRSPCTCVPVLMPGLWDVHTHFIGMDIVSGTSDLANYMPGANALVGAITVDDLKETLMAGYTSVRELGGWAGDLWPGVQMGRLIGPNVYSSIAIMSQTGGHGDNHAAPLLTVKEAMIHGGTPELAVCDGVDECIKTVRTLIRRGARCIKVCSSGGVLSLNDDPEDRQFSDAELKAIVEEAGRSRRAVAAHAIGKAGIMSALHAGVRSIEHGMYLDDEACDLILEKDAYFVATQHIVRTLRKDYFETLPPSVQRKLLTVSERSKESYKLAVKRRLKIALGTDMLSSDRASNLSHGNNAHELQWAIEAGMTPLQAIESATANGPGVLGGLAPKSGQLKAGYDADILAISSSPLEDVSVLANKDNITHIWKGGVSFKGPKGSH